MSRAVWKGAISFGLIHVPVSLHPASTDSRVDFDWLDARTLDPVGYKRVNKRTGREISSERIVKGVKQKNGEYVVLSDEEIRAAYPKTTQTIELEGFVPATDISFVFIDRPYYLAPEGKGTGKVYALLREAMSSSSLVAIGSLVMHNKQHLVTVLPAGPALMLGTLRWSADLRSADDLDLPPATASANNLSAAEVKMANRLISQMTMAWRPEDYSDRFNDAIRTLVQRKARAGEGRTVKPLEDAPVAAADNVVDLTALLKQSLKGGRSASSAPQPKAPKPTRSGSPKSRSKKAAAA